MTAGFADIHIPRLTKSEDELTDGEKLGLYMHVGGEVDITTEAKPDGAMQIKITSRVPFAVKKNGDTWTVGIRPER